MSSNKKGYMNSYYKKNKSKWLNKKETHKRVLRNAARRKLVAKYGKKALNGKDAGHRNPLRKGGSNKMSNLKIESRKLNRNRHK